MKLVNFLFYCLVLMTLNPINYKIFAQTPDFYCGTLPSGKNVLVDIEKLQTQRNTLVQPEVLKVFVHLTTNNSATIPTINPDTVIARINDMRNQFNNHGICFIVAGFEIIPNTDLDSQYVIASHDEESELIPYLKPGVLNIFVHHYLIHSNNIVGGGVAYDVPNPYLSIAESALSGVCCKIILTHEMGHCLGLHHTHAGGKENVDRVGACKNCETTGDLVCDTPADPGLNIPGMMSGCTYVGTVTDSCGWSYNPDPQNIMSYSPRECQNYFTTGQGLRMLWHIQNITDLNAAIAPVNIVFSTTGSWSSGEHFYLAEQNIILNSTDLSVVNSAQVTFGAGDAVTILPGTTFSPQGGFVVLSAQDVCQPNN